MPPIRGRARYRTLAEILLLLFGQLSESSIAVGAAMMPVEIHNQQSGFAEIDAARALFILSREPRRYNSSVGGTLIAPFDGWLFG
jgi:hypothetical protein